MHFAQNHATSHIYQKKSLKELFSYVIKFSLILCRLAFQRRGAAAALVLHSHSGGGRKVRHRVLLGGANVLECQDHVRHCYLLSLEVIPFTSNFDNKFISNLHCLQVNMISFGSVLTETDLRVFGLLLSRSQTISIGPSLRALTPPHLGLAKMLAKHESSVRCDLLGPGMG